MKNSFKILISALVFSLFICSIPFEKRIKEKDVPPKIRDYLKENYPGYKRPTFYLETINDTVYYEVDIKYKKEELTLLFLENGTLYEIEKEEKFKNLPDSVKENITKALSLKFEKYDIQHVEYLNPHLVIEHELKISGEIDSVEKYYEFRFDKEGNVISFKEIPLEPIQSLF